VTTIWDVQTESLKGSETRVVQGWLPHHLRTTKQQLQFNGLQYQTPRGIMKTAVGSHFEIAYRFNGLVPNLPAPKSIGGEHDFNPGRMHDYVAQYATKTNYGGDTYWG